MNVMLRLKILIQVLATYAKCNGSTIVAFAAIGAIMAKYPVVDINGNVMQNVENQTPLGTSLAFILNRISFIFSFA